MSCHLPEGDGGSRYVKESRYRRIILLSMGTGHVRCYIRQYGWGAGRYGLEDAPLPVARPIRIAPRCAPHHLFFNAVQYTLIAHSHSTHTSHHLPLSHFKTNSRTRTTSRLANLPSLLTRLCARPTDRFYIGNPRKFRQQHVFPQLCSSPPHTCAHRTQPLMLHTLCVRCSIPLELLLTCRLVQYSKRRSLLSQFSRC